MDKNPQSFIREAIQEFECILCTEGYDEEQKHPMIICPSQHHCCLKCLNNMLFMGKGPNETADCPMCKVRIYQRDAQRFRLLHEIRITAKRLRTHGSSIGNNIRQLNEEKGSLEKRLEDQMAKNQWLIKEIEQIKKNQKQLSQENEMLKKQLKQQTMDKQEKYEPIIEQKRSEVIQEIEEKEIKIEKDYLEQITDELKSKTEEQKSKITKLTLKCKGIIASMQKYFWNY